MDRIREKFGIRDKFSLENARHLCEEVERIEETTLGNEAEQLKSKVLEASLQAIRSLTEVLVWMDRNQEEWFERVMERDVISTLERLITNGLMPSAIKLQSLQSVTVLLQNLSRTSSIYYICSNNHINRMIAVEFDMHHDEFVSLYVSFLKTLALRCTADTVQFFFDLQDNAFPLWDRAARLLSSGDTMVRTAAKQITLTIAQLQDSAVSAFVQRAVADVFLSVMRNVDGKLTKLAADIPSHTSLQRFIRPMQTMPTSVNTATTVVQSSSPSPGSSPSPPQHQQQQKHPPEVNTHVLAMQLEDIEDELLYLNDVCHTPVPNVGRQAAVAAQNLFLSRFQRIVVEETWDATAAARSPPSSPPTSSAAVSYQPHMNFLQSTPLLDESRSDIPASVALAFLFYWSQINTDFEVSAALMGFLVHPIQTAARAATHGTTMPLNNGHTHSSYHVASSLAALVLQSSRVDLHEAVIAVFEHTLMQCSFVSSSAHVEAFLNQDLSSPTFSATSCSLPHFPTSLSQFYFAATPYQQTGKVLVGGPRSTLPPSKEKFVQKAWVGDSDTCSSTSSAGGGDSCSRSTSPPAPQEVLSGLIPHLFAALHSQLRYFHVTRLSCFSSTLSLLVKLLPRDTRAERRMACAKVWETAFLEIMKLIQRYLLNYVKQYASVIQKTLRAQQVAECEVPLSRISFAEIEDSSAEEAPLPIRDPYAVMFLKLCEAARWLDADVAEREALLSAEHKKEDVYLFFQAFPSLDKEACNLMLSTWPPLKAFQYSGFLPQHQQKQQQPRDQLASAYHSVQMSVTRAFALPQRSPVSAAECELNLYLMFLLVRHSFESCAFAGCNTLRCDDHSQRSSRTDILRLTLRKLCPQLTPADYFTLSSSTAALSVRCELTNEWHHNTNEAAFAALGTPLCFVLPSAFTGEGGREVLFLDTNDNAPEQNRKQELYTGGCKRRVLLSLDLSFVGVALHPRYPFKVVLSYQLAERAMLLHLVMCDTATAKAVVLEVEKAANECRARGASFCFGIMNYRSALLDEPVG